MLKLQIVHSNMIGVKSGGALSWRKAKIFERIKELVAKRLGSKT